MNSPAVEIGGPDRTRGRLRRGPAAQLAGAGIVVDDFSLGRPSPDEVFPGSCST
jgi:hypothetical protein